LGVREYQKVENPCFRGLKNNLTGVGVRASIYRLARSRSGVANLYGPRAILFGKTLHRAFFALEAKIFKSQYLLFCPTIDKNNIFKALFN
jgi:hypothetical protein